MTLVIPEAQTPFSPVEQPRMDPGAATVWDGVGALADSLIEVRAQKVKAENERTLRTARLTAIERLDEARLAYETDGNLDGLTDRWQAEAARVTGEVAATLPAHMRRDFDLSMREMVAPQTSAIRRREYALFQDRETAAFQSDLRRWEKAAAAAPDRESRDAILADAGAGVVAAVDAGLLSAAEADRMMADIPANAAAIEAMTIIAEDPQAYLDRAGEFAADLPADQHARNIIAAKAGVAREGERIAREDAILARKAEAELKSEVDTAVTILEGGRPYAGLADLMARTEGTAQHDRIQATVDAVGTETNFALMTPEGMDDYIAAKEKTATSDPADIARLDRLRAMRTRAAESLATDPLAHVRARGIAEVPPVDIADPASVGDRVALAEAVFAEYTPGATTIRYFDAAETSALAAELSSPDPERALGVIARIQQSFGDRAPLALAQIGEKDPVAHLAGALVWETGDTGAARTILRGRALKAEGGGATLDGALRRQIAAEYAPLVAWTMTPDGRVIRDAGRFGLALKAADAHYAASGGGIADPKSDEAAVAWRASLDAVLAATDRGGQRFGGRQTVNDEPVALPGSLDAGAVEQALNHFPADLWKKASVTGNLPLWGAGPKARPLTDFEPGDRALISPVSLGGGLYALQYRLKSGEARFLRDDGRPDGLFVFDLGQLVAGGAR